MMIRLWGDKTYSVVEIKLNLERGLQHLCDVSTGLQYLVAGVDTYEISVVLFMLPEIK